MGSVCACVCVCLWGGSTSSHLLVFSQLMHPVLESLRNTDKQWLIDTLYAFNGGNVEKFQGYKSSWGQQVSGQRSGRSRHRILVSICLCSSLTSGSRCLCLFCPDLWFQMFVLA